MRHGVGGMFQKDENTGKLPSEEARIRLNMNGFSFKTSPDSMKIEQESGKEQMNRFFGVLNVKLINSQVRNF